jgi:hypothetical protein
MKRHIPLSVAGPIGTRQYANQTTVALVEVTKFVRVVSLVANEVMVLAKGGSICSVAVVSAY